MNWTNIAIYFCLAIHLVVCLLMVLVILMQRSKQEGLGAAFGGGITDSMFGAQTSQVLVKTTVVLSVLFFVLTIILARLYASRNNAEGGALQKALLATPATAPATPGVTTEAKKALEQGASTAAETAKAAAESADKPVVPADAPKTPAPAKK